MKKFKRVLSIISSISLLNFNGIVFDNIGNAMQSIKQPVSGQFALNHNYTYDELVVLLNLLEKFIEKSTSGKNISLLEKETLKVEKQYLMLNGVKKKYLKKLNSATLENLSEEINITDSIYLKYFEHVDSGGIGCCRAYAGFVHELLKKFGVESYVICTRNSRDQSTHTAVMVKMPICEGRFPWYVVPCVVNNHMDVTDIIKYLIIISMGNRNRDIGGFWILNKFGGTFTKKLTFNVPLTCCNIPYAGKEIIKLLNNITNELKETAKK